MAVRYSKYLPASVFLTDLLLLNFALYNAHFIIYGTYKPDSTSALFILLVTSTWVVISAFSKSFKVNRPLVLSENINRFLLTLIYHLAVILGVIFFFRLYAISRFELIVSYALFFVLVIVHRSVLFFFLDYIRKRGYNHRQIVIIGDEVISRQLKHSFFHHPEYGYDLADFISDEQISKMQEDDLVEKLLGKYPDEIFICYRQMDGKLLKSLFRMGEEHSIKIKVVTDLALSGNYAELVSYHNIPVLNILSTPGISMKVKVIKRSFDLLFSLTLMVIGAPVFVLLYLVTKATSKGPAFYRQQRVGKNQRPIYIYKFRSMHVNAEAAGPQLSSQNDPRITKWGRVMRKSRLDELPQFWNVLKGEMSVVGPRPERQHFIEQIIEKSPNHKKLLSIKPGITSIGQVAYGYAEDVEQMRERSRYDLVYLNNINLNSDVGIILKTIRVMVQLKGK